MLFWALLASGRWRGLWPNRPSLSQLTSRPELGGLEMPEMASPNSNTNRDGTLFVSLFSSQLIN